MLRRRERNPAVARWMAKQRTSDLHLSVVSVGEVERGIAQQRRLNPAFAAALAAWLDGMVTLCSGRILPADIYGRLVAEVRLNDENVIALL